MQRRSLVIFALLLPSTVMAGENNPTFGMGGGISTCASFAQDYASSPKAVENDYYEWAEGFMTAMNEAAMAGKRKAVDLTSISQDAQMMLIRRYCDKHPLAMYMEAVQDVYASLQPIHR